MTERPVLATTREAIGLADKSISLLLRMMKKQPTGDPDRIEWNDCIKEWVPWKWSDRNEYAGGERCGPSLRCPFGDIEDRLWTRETWTLTDDEGAVRGPIPLQRPPHLGIAYRADGHDLDFWRPSIFMPRWACRTLLGIHKLAALRAKEIDTVDMLAMGYLGASSTTFLNGVRGTYITESPREEFAREEKKAWDGNLWCWLARVYKISQQEKSCISTGLRIGCGQERGGHAIHARPDSR
jgi:hypothetical protein